MLCALSPRSQAISPATSVGRATLVGMLRLGASRSAPNKLRAASVSAMFVAVLPGHTMLQRIRSALYIEAMDLVRPRSPCLAVV